VTSLGFRTDLALRVLEGAIRVYRACGLTDRESQFSFERPST